MAPKILVGTGTWGHNYGIDQVRDQIAQLDKLDCQQIDTSALYPFTNPGVAETILGEIGHEGILVDTKTMWFDGGNNTLTVDAVRKSMTESLERLKTKKVNTFYAQGPDHVTPLKDQAAAFDAVYREGKCTKTGISNFSPESFEEYLNICEEMGYVKPRVFEGQYNLLCRTYETTLFPLLRKYGISFVAYSPLAGGMLTGKVTLSKNNPDALRGTRFEVSKDNLMGMAGRHWYDKPAFHDAIRKLDSLCKAHGVDMIDASMRWILNHSILDGEQGDCVIVGPRSQNQLDTYASAIHGGPLPPNLVEGMNDLWDGVADDAAPILVY
ncbi:Aldo/keto reductase [Annulohypoxylon truncatum]|uniref:Aldo/keto reductase n=1 Tax=Annulohypoxylon truncatum TaxID=327061 RepID=UPI002008C8CE|nr:Aldo/keto reductase [Annulohypoxylon truncatum]KAI1213725.1 Aldo/keto reductase [Annulohypoxylon truncatum]